MILKTDSNFNVLSNNSKDKSKSKSNEEISVNDEGELIITSIKGRINKSARNKEQIKFFAISSLYAFSDNPYEFMIDTLSPQLPTSEAEEYNEEEANEHNFMINPTEYDWRW